MCNACVIASLIGVVKGRDEKGDGILTLECIELMASDFVHGCTIKVNGCLLHNWVFLFCI